jgi:hypothetical protein
VDQAPYISRTPQETKTCPHCKRELVLAQFYYRNKTKGWRQRLCKKCKQAEDRVRKRGPRKKPRSPNDKVHARRCNLWRNYKITLEQYDELFQAQQGVCAICYRPEDPRYTLAVDHDHDTEKVRSLLCRKCNTGIGALGDSPQLLHAAADYLIRHGKGRVS